MLVVSLSVCATSPEIARHVDHEWFRQALASEAAHWRDAAFTPSGFFKVNLDRQWRQVGNQSGTLVSQGRQIVVMTEGYELTRDPSYLNALRKGTNFLLAHFRDPDKGLFFYSTTPEGKVIDDGKDSYGMAFTILALSHAARVTGDERYKQAALETWAQMKEHLRDSVGFFKPKTDRNYTKIIGQNTQNPMMHLFEALLALHDATSSKEVLQDAEALANRIYTRLYQEREGRLPEIYDGDWKPAGTAHQGYIELGHQFEWAFLLSHAVEKGFPKSYLKVGERLLNYGMKVSYDNEMGGIFSRGDYSGGVVRGPKGWWEQCESLRAMMHWAVQRGRTDLWPTFDKSLAFSKKNFIDAEYGGWYSSYDPEKPNRSPGKGNIWQVGYHVCGLYVEVLPLSQ